MLLDVPLFHESLAQGAAVRAADAESEEPVLYKGMTKILEDISGQGFATIRRNDNALAKFISECRVGALVGTTVVGVPEEFKLAANNSGCDYIIMPISQTMRLLLARQLQSRQKL